MKAGIVRCARDIVPGGKPTIFTRRAGVVVGADGETELTGSGANRFVQRIVSVKTGSARMRREFARQADRFRINWEHIGADENATLPDGTINPYDRDGANREALHGVTSEFLIWGTLWDVDSFLSCVLGDGKPVASETDVVGVHVSMSSGSGRAEKGSAADKRIRNQFRSRDEREARELREELNRTPETSRDSVYHADYESTIAGRAAIILPRFVDVANDPPERLAYFTDAIYRFIKREKREPKDMDDLREFLMKQ